MRYLDQFKELDRNLVRSGTKNGAEKPRKPGPVAGDGRPEWLELSMNRTTR